MSDKTKQIDEKVIQLTGPCSIVQAKAVDGEPEKLPAVQMDVYNGGKMTVKYWGPVVIDLRGLNYIDQVPIAYAHETNSIDSILGQTSKIAVGDTITATGALTGDSDLLKSVVVHAKNGFNFQSSIGAQPLTYKSVAEGESVEANGQTHEGPFTLMVTSKLKEVSIVPLGADDSTSAAIAAAHKPEEGKMSDTNKVEQTAEQIKAEAIKTVKDRIAAVSAEAKDYPDIMAKAIANDWDAPATKLAVLEAKNATLEAEKVEAKKAADLKKLEAERPNTPHVRNVKSIEGAMTVESITAAACRNLGMKDVSAQFKDDDLNKSDDIRARSFTEIVQATLALSGKTTDATHRDPASMLKAAFSTRDIANVVSNIGNKFISEGFGAGEETWKLISEIIPMNDFKVNTGVDYVMGGLLDELAPDGEIQHAELSDTTRTIQLKTYAKMLAITRQDIINDDLGLFAAVAKRFGFMSIRTLNTKFWAALQAAIAGNFTAPNGNLITTALGLAGLTDAETAFGALTDVDGNPIGMDASMVLTSKGLGVTARTLCYSPKVQGSTAKEPDGNPFANRYLPIDTSYRTGDPWFLVGNPVGIPLMSVGFLNGNQSPVIESADADFNALGIQTRCVYDFGVAFANKDAAVYSSADA